MHNMSISELNKKLADKEFSCVELSQYYLQRINKLDKKFNSFITLDEEYTLKQAQAADEAIANNQQQLLTGIPIAHKDIFCTQGLKTSCGSLMLDNFNPPYDATIVTNLGNAGTVTLGKTNMDEFAMGSSNENSYYGNVVNPWGDDLVPGGSSGGSAAAVAARLAVAATASDTGGSIRQPAAFCGVTGIKPTYGLASRYGMIAFASSLDQAGIMANSAEDCATVLQAMCGFDQQDSTSINANIQDYRQHLNNDLSSLTIGIPEQFFDKNLDPDVSNVTQTAIDELKKLGIKTKAISLPNLMLSIPVYYVIAPAECSSNLARYDGVAYGYRCKDPENLADMFTRTRTEAFGTEVKRRILIGTYVLSAGYYEAYYLKAQKIRRIIANDFKEAFKEVDAIIGPTTPTAAFKFGSKTKDPVSMYLNDIYTTSANLAGIPGLSIPAGKCNGLPIGLQIIGDHFSESILFNIAHQYQQVTNWHLETPASIAEEV